MLFSTTDAPVPKVASHCLVGISISLLLVGLVSGTFVRHIIQIIPMIIVALVPFRKKGDYQLTIALSMLSFWLLIMVLIWLFLLGIAKIVTGHYSVSEIILTIIMALISSYGLFKSSRHKFQRNKYLLALIFIAGFGIQYAFLVLSYRLRL